MSPKELALLLPCRSYWNINQGRQDPESLPQARGPRLGTEEGKIQILSKAKTAPPSAFAGHKLFSLLRESPVFSFSGTGGIYFLCHFGGCLPCQRLFCRVKKDKKVVSRLFGGGREDCLVRERGPLRFRQTHAALPLRPPLRETLALGTRPVHPHTSPPLVFLGDICSCAGDQRSRSHARVRICLSWNLGNAADECSIQHLDCKSRRALATVRALFAGYVENRKRQEPSPGCPRRGENTAVIWQLPRFRKCLLSGSRRELASPGHLHRGSPEDARSLLNVSVPSPPTHCIATWKFSSAPPDPTPTPRPG